MIDLKNLVSLPYYNVRIPSTGKVVSFRPFVVKEEKIMLIAKQSEKLEEIQNCMKEVLKSCFREQINFDELPYFDTEFLFINLRMKSMGEEVEVVVKDPVTKEKFDTTINLEKIKIINFDKNRDMNIKLNDNLIIEMSYPPMSSFLSSKEQNIYSTISSCIKTIYTKEQAISTKDIEKEKILEFIDSLTQEMFDKLLEFFKNMPKVVYQDEFISPTTGNKIPVRITNFNDFFR